ncbi:MAG: PEP-CTERM sorting domain-containing protein [Aquabacterium sp.]
MNMLKEEIMKRLSKLWVCSLALTAMGSAYAAQTQVNLERDGLVVVPGLYHYDWGWPRQVALGQLQGTTTLAYSDYLEGALGVTYTEVQTVLPAMLDESGINRVVSSPVQSMGGTFNDETQTFTFTRVGSAGGMLWTMPAVRRDGKRNPASTGGSLQLTNLTVDLVNQSVRADVKGANGVGTLSQLPIWHYGQITGVTSDQTPNAMEAWDGFQADFTVSQFTMDDRAFEVMATSLGFTSFGRTAFMAVDGFGSLHVSAVTGFTVLPEPSSILFMGLGLAGLGWASRRTQAA